MEHYDMWLYIYNIPFDSDSVLLPSKFTGWMQLALIWTTKASDVLIAVSSSKYWQKNIVRRT